MLWISGVRIKCAVLQVKLCKTPRKPAIMSLITDSSVQFYIRKNMGYCLKMYQNGPSHIKVKKKYQKQCSTVGYSSISPA